NPQLELCHELEICDFLMNGGEYIINANAPGCNNFDEVIELCNLTWKNLIEGDIRFDFDQNGCTASDSPLQNTMIKAVSGGVTYSTFANAEGHYRLFVPEGTYIMSVQSPYMYFQGLPSQTFVTFNGVGNQEQVDFCATA